MNRFGTKTTHIAMIAVGLIVGGMLAGTVAFASRTPSQAKVKTAYLSISTMDMAPDGLWDTSSDYFNAWDGNVLFNNDGVRCFDTGVNLPQGAVIRSVTWFYESDSTSDLFGTLVRGMPSAATTKTVAKASPSNDDGVPRSVTKMAKPKLAKVNNHKFQYGLGVCPPPGTEFLGARIKYTYKG